MADSGDTAWILTSTALVLFMTLPGLALFYGGLVQSKNILSVLMQCISIACLASVLWVVAGYSLAFTEGNALVGGLSKAFLFGVTREALADGTKIPETLFIMFQMTFAIITPALICGAYVERIKFSAVMLFSGAWLLIVYAPVTHWVWGGGWLAQMGVLDFAGGLVVHVTAGVSALVVVWQLGPRPGYPKQVRPPHAPWMVMVGAAMLWVGWFGFNAGSALSAGTDASMAMLVTHLSAATASLVWLGIEWVKYGKPSLVGLVTGTIAGLATITPASGFVGPAGGYRARARRRIRVLLRRRCGQEPLQSRRFAGRHGGAWRGRRDRDLAGRCIRRDSPRRRRLWRGGHHGQPVWRPGHRRCRHHRLGGARQSDHSQGGEGRVRPAGLRRRYHRRARFHLTRREGLPFIGAQV